MILNPTEDIACSTRQHYCWRCCGRMWVGSASVAARTPNPNCTPHGRRVLPQPLLLLGQQQERRKPLQRSRVCSGLTLCCTHLDTNTRMCDLGLKASPLRGLCLREADAGPQGCHTPPPAACSWLTNLLMV